MPLGFDANTTDAKASIAPIRNTDTARTNAGVARAGVKKSDTTNLARSTAGGDRTTWLQTALALL